MWSYFLREFRNRVAFVCGHFVNINLAALTGATDIYTFRNWSCLIFLRRTRLFWTFRLSVSVYLSGFWEQLACLIFLGRTRLFWTFRSSFSVYLSGFWKQLVSRVICVRIFLFIIVVIYLCNAVYYFGD